MPNVALNDNFEVLLNAKLLFGADKIIETHVTITPVGITCMVHFLWIPCVQTKLESSVGTKDSPTLMKTAI